MTLTWGKLYNFIRFSDTPAKVRWKGHLLHWFAVNLELGSACSVLNLFEIIRIQQILGFVFLGGESALFCLATEMLYGRVLKSEIWGQLVLEYLISLKISFCPKYSYMSPPALLPLPVCASALFDFYSPSSGTCFNCILWIANSIV